MTQNALIIGASGGIGAAVAQDLETRGWQVTRLSRARDGLDIGDQANVDAHLEAQNGPYELVFMASGVLAAEGGAPEKALSQIRQESFEEVFKVSDHNAIIEPVSSRKLHKCFAEYTKISPLTISAAERSS